jgi:suppressor of ftsI
MSFVLALAVCAEAALNYCSALVPTPDLDSVTGVVQLEAPTSVSAVPLSARGVPAYRLAITADGLPPAASLGPYTVYVAWATSLTMDSVVKLGVIHNGRNEIGALERIQFRILVSAERSAAVTTRQGRLVLRGTSPSVRLLAHRDLMTPFAPGAAAVTGMSGMDHDDAVLPLRAGTAPVARASTTIALRDGDTLSLVAMRVERRVAGRSFIGYGYNGEYPGPTLQVTRGSRVTVRFENRIDQPTTVHWHGLRLDNRSDGVAGLTQDLVPSGGTFTYSLRFPDAGIFWYHSHEREDVQQGLGLYGNIVVTQEPARVNRQIVLTIQDLLLDDTGLVPFGVDAPTHVLMGRFGNTFLVNGETRPTWSVHRNDVVRFLLTNVSNARTYNLVFDHARAKIVGSDLGAYEHDAPVDNILIAPAERYIVDVQFPRAGRVTLVNQIQALNHRFGVFSPETDTLGVFQVDTQRAAPDFSRAFRHIEHRQDLDAYRSYATRPVDHTLQLEMRTRDLPAAIANMFTGASIPVDMNDGMAGMNGLTTAREITWVLRDSATGAENMDIHWRFVAGTVAKIRMFNDPIGPHPMAHPIHVHGQRMLVLERNGVLNENLVWKDTILVPAGETDDVLLDLSNPGTWMLHCHIAEHRGSGMMMSFVVDSSP